MSAAEFVPSSADLEGLRAAARSCRGCHLYEKATQTVFSRGAVTSRVVLVGEQPGDAEDRRGGPFVWPAGKRTLPALAPAGGDAPPACTRNFGKTLLVPSRRGGQS